MKKIIKEITLQEIRENLYKTNTQIFCSLVPEEEYHSCVSCIFLEDRCNTTRPICTRHAKIFKQVSPLQEMLTLLKEKIK